MTQCQERNVIGCDTMSGTLHVSEGSSPTAHEGRQFSKSIFHQQELMREVDSSVFFPLPNPVFHSQALK